VMYTYKQEFVVNVVSNPFFSSSSIVHRGPYSKLEMAYYNASRHNQTASDIGMFPNLIHDKYNKSAFWAVNRMPSTMYAAGEFIQSQKMEDATYYWDQQNRQVHQYSHAVCFFLS
jgi:hypothetical protein